MERRDQPADLQNEEKGNNRHGDEARGQEEPAHRVQRLGLGQPPNGFGQTVNINMTGISVMNVSLLDMKNQSPDKLCSCHCHRSEQDHLKGLGEKWRIVGPVPKRACFRVGAAELQSRSPWTASRILRWLFGSDHGRPLVHMPRKIRRHDV